MITGLSLDPSAAGLIATIYAMFFGGLLILGARLGDRYGHRRILLVGIIAFTLVSVIGGTSTVVEIPQLVMARQGRPRPKMTVKASVSPSAWTGRLNGSSSDATASVSKSGSSASSVELVNATIASRDAMPAKASSTCTATPRLPGSRPAD
jgi:MFS family permease